LKPHTTTSSLLFLLAFFACIWVISWTFPDRIYPIGDAFHIRIPSLHSVLEKTTKTDITHILAIPDTLIETSMQDVDSTVSRILQDSTDILRAGEVDEKGLKVIQPIEYADGSTEALHSFFGTLAGGVHAKRAVRILHYGDSQIEGDRITQYIRQRLQNSFGGIGPGFISLMPLAPTPDLKQSWSSNWDRYTNFTKVDRRVPHNQFGPGAGFVRYVPFPLQRDSISVSEGWCTIKRMTRSAMAAHKIKLYYGNSTYKTSLVIESQGNVLVADSLQAGGSFHIFQYELPQGTKEFTLRFSGKDSPDVYGLSLEGDGGLLVDNYGLRGSSGTFFNKIDRRQLKSFYDHFQVKLMILQFGGNTLPYMHSREQADQFGRYFSAQIQTLKKLVPDASFLVLGPSDMSVKEGTEFVTHPHLESLRDAIKKAAFTNQCAFFDVYQSMGGKNSMVSWVEAGIAAKDYIHFMPNGARKVGSMVYASLIQDYNQFV